MRLFPITVLMNTLIVVSIVHAQSDVAIRNPPLVDDKVMSVAISTEVVTTMTFPHEILSVTGYGIAQTEDHSSTKFVCDPVKPTKFLNLRCVRIGSTAQMKVQLADQRFYVFQLQWSPRPDALINWKSISSDSIPQAKEVGAAEVKQRRPRYSPTRLISFLKLANGEPILRKQMPQAFKSIQTRDAHYERTYKNAITRITRVHRFTKEDVLVLEAEIENTSEQPIRFNPHHLEIRIGSSQYRPALAQASGHLPPKQTTPVQLIIASGLTGEREPIHIANAFYLTWRSQNTSPTPPKPTR